ncbi:hypothetical protein R1flu_021802 [Riccia fluitans]|uniref:Uncharacterized protein n=1 Tax=Riccia fluitans TaxID=41844 RepID=A0ABD1ZTJ7_9MARC
MKWETLREARAVIRICESVEAQKLCRTAYWTCSFCRSLKFGGDSHLQSLALIYYYLPRHVLGTMHSY